FRMIYHISIAISCLFVLSSAAVVVVDPRLENSINIHSNWRDSIEAKECNIYDEAHYCQQLVIDQRQSLVAISQKCVCPTGYRCPANTDDTQMITACEFDSSRRWNKCKMRCTAEEV
ncbi:hypothetical protein PFISCL1PPCAC_16127, partial [Pristionchus fissidentatus]